MANIKKMANLTTNTKSNGQITLNTKPHSDPSVVGQFYPILFYPIFFISSSGRSDK